MSPQTHWKRVVLLITASVIAAFQIGKAAIALPLFRQDLGMTLVAASWVISVYAGLNAGIGLTAGAVVSRIGTRRALIGGLLVIGVGSIFGGLAPSGGLLIATRLLEGCGFLAVVISAPTLIRIFTNPRDRDVAMTCYSAYVPIGTAVMLLVGPLIESLGWQLLWFINGAIAVAYAGVMWISLRGHVDDVNETGVTLLSNVLDVLRSPAPMLLAIAFIAYSFQYHAMTGLLPTLLVEQMGLSITSAGIVVAIAVIANGLGNLAAGLLLRFGVALWAVTAFAFACLGFASFGIFSGTLPVAIVTTLAAGSLAVTGLIPAVIMAATSRQAVVAPFLAISFALMVQASSIGQFAGPATFATWVEIFGWSSAYLVFVAVAVIGIGIAVSLRRLLPR